MLISIFWFHRRNIYYRCAIFSIKKLIFLLHNSSSFPKNCWVRAKLSIFSSISLHNETTEKNLHCWRSNYWNAADDACKELFLALDLDPTDFDKRDVVILCKGYDLLLYNCLRCLNFSAKNGSNFSKFFQIWRWWPRTKFHQTKVEKTLVNSPTVQSQAIWVQITLCFIFWRILIVFRSALSPEKSLYSSWTVLSTYWIPSIFWISITDKPCELLKQTTLKSGQCFLR